MDNILNTERSACEKKECNDNLTNSKCITINKLEEIIEKSNKTIIEI